MSRSAVAGSAVVVAVFAAVFQAADLGRALGGIPDGSNVKDARLIVWILSWVNHAMRTPEANVFDANIFHPAPAMLTGSEHLFSLQLLFTPLRWLGAGPVQAATLSAYGTYPLAALAMAALLRRGGCTMAVAIVVGVQFALGAYRVPFNFQVLQYPNVLLPLIALTMTRLWERPGWPTAAAVTVAASLGLLTSFYAGILVMLVAGVWGMVLYRPWSSGSKLPVGLAVLAVCAAVLLAAVALWPYFLRAEAVVVRGMPWEFVDFWRPLVAEGLAPLRWVLVLALCAPVFAGSQSTSWKQLGCPALAVALVGAWLVLCGLPGVLGDVAAVTPLRYFRGWSRLQIVIDFGACILAAITLDGCRRRFGGRIGMVVIVGFVCVATLPRLSRFGAFGAIPTPALAQHARAYRDLATMADGVGGAVVELPWWRPVDETHAMLGSTIHWLPLANGFTAFVPAHHDAVRALIRELPAAPALHMLVDMVGLRWILFWPAAESPLRGRAASLRRRLERSPLLARRPSASDVALFEVLPSPATTRWYDALAEWPRAGHTVFGVPIRRLSEDEAGARVKVKAIPARMAPGSRLVTRLLVTNTGTADWPVVFRTPVGNGSSIAALAVHVEERWVPVNAPGPPVVQRHVLIRDVEAGGRLVQSIVLHAPRRGLYRVEIGIAQENGLKFGGPRSTTGRPVTVTPMTRPRRGRRQSAPRVKKGPE